MSAITTAPPEFIRDNWPAFLSLRAANPAALAAHLETGGFAAAPSIYGALHHLHDAGRDRHALIYRSGIVKLFAPSWDALRPVVDGAIAGGFAR